MAKDKKETEGMMSPVLPCRLPTITIWLQLFGEREKLTVEFDYIQDERDGTKTLHLLYGGEDLQENKPIQSIVRRGSNLRITQYDRENDDYEELNFIVNDEMNVEDVEDERERRQEWLDLFEDGVKYWISLGNE